MIIRQELCHGIFISGVTIMMSCVANTARCSGNFGPGQDMLVLKSSFVLEAEGKTCSTGSFTWIFDPFEIPL
jgi:hypothetical protein